MSPDGCFHAVRALFRRELGGPPRGLDFLPIADRQVRRLAIDHDLLDRAGKSVGGAVSLTHRRAGVLADVEGLIRRVLSHPSGSVDAPLFTCVVLFLGCPLCGAECGGMRKSISSPVCAANCLSASANEMKPISRESTAPAPYLPSSES